MYQKMETNPLFQSYLDSVYINSHSQRTVDSYLSALRHLEKFTAQKHQCDIGSLLSRIREGQLDVYKVMNDFVMYLDKSGKKASSIQVWTMGVKGFFRHHEIKIYNEDFKQRVRMPRKIQHSELPMTKEILIRLLRNCNHRLQAVILVAVASGMRIGEIVQLRTSDIDFDSKPVMIRIRAETAKGRKSRETFLTSEASSTLQDYLKRTFGWDKSSKQAIPVFRKLENDTKHDPKAIESSLLNSLKGAISEIPDLAVKNENGRYAVHFHAFRKYFRTVVGDVVGRDFAENLAGHKLPLDTYYLLPEARKKENYLKAEPHLTISDYRDIEKRLAKTAEKQKEFEYNQAMFAKALQHSFGLPSGLLEMLMNETK